MKILSIDDKRFTEFGREVKGDFGAIFKLLEGTECPDTCTIYVASDRKMEAVPEADRLCVEEFGGQPIQIGYCNGHNVKLNCLEYHKSSEINIAANDVVLLLGRRQDIVDGKYDTAKVEAFLLPAGRAVELYATSMHYAPCGVNGGGFRVAVVLPRGTNGEKPSGAEDTWLFANNKWLLAHKDTDEARGGAYIGLVGANPEVNKL